MDLSLLFITGSQDLDLDVFCLGPPAPNMLGSDAKTHLESRCCLQAILIANVWSACCWGDAGDTRPIYLTPYKT